ncbi:hypothetical protein [Sphingomonas sp. R1]|uniref:hypothetical protein n=1 Tax=Sphingomonas sp. R1 TaxID=399176 RepID=UPI002224145D|nr:hypothetical protein [Sphingomonas sp. R1]UYY77498.1 hypothetical protein OIM94_00345 [Sphingomonas sp. R1]
MATVTFANSYNTARGNTAWSNLDTTEASALLQDAEDYIRSVYKVRTNLTTDEQRIFDGLVCRLAATFQTDPAPVAAPQAVKMEKKELAGMKKETEYFQSNTDPYPYITATIRPFLVATTATTVSFGKLVR